MFPARPNKTNEQDACCRCGKLLPTPKEHTQPEPGTLHVHQLSPADPPQWICPDCEKEIAA